ncbi:MAG: pilus motility taxis protein HmpF [Cuspidothrix sp.]
MLYLAEVQKQKGGLLSGGGKSELKLLACQRNDQNWTPVPEEVVPSEEANKINDGALVLVELSPSRQVQRIQEAGRPLVSILQNFSRQMEKLKLKEDEIDNWKQSLMIQAQELNRREREMEARLEQVQQLENDFKRLDTQQQVVDTSRAEIDRLRAEVERNRQELEGAWKHLRGEQQRFEESKADSQKHQIVDEERNRALLDLVNRLSGQRTPTETVRESVNVAMELAGHQQDTLNLHWQKLELQRHAITQQQQEIEQLGQTLGDRQNELQQARNSLTHQLTQVQLKTAIVETKQKLVNRLQQYIETEESIYQKLHTLATNTETEVTQPEIDVEAVQQMPLAELEKMIQGWQEKLYRDSSFVQEQEPELKYKQELIEELQKKITHAAGEERTNLEVELADERDIYQMLNESLVGQRRNLIAQQKTLQQHQAVLWQRQGISGDITSEGTDLESIASRLEAQKQQKSEELQNLEGDIAQILEAIAAEQGTIDHQTQEIAAKSQEIKSLEERLLNLRSTNAESCGQVNFYQEALQPIQDALDSVRDQLQNIAESLTDVETTEDSQLQTITEMRHTLERFMNVPGVVI